MAKEADGTSVYPAWLQPNSYNFGTKIYSRLELWLCMTVEEQLWQQQFKLRPSRYLMGYGDKGLARALNWERTMEAYGVNDSIQEQVAR